MQKVESRTLQIRAAAGDEFALVGRAVKYNQISSNELAPGLRERIVPGCFAASLAAGGDVKALLCHDSTGLPLGRLANQTLLLSDSEAGLDIRIQLDQANSMHKDVYAAVKRLDISEMSFAFSCLEEDISSDVYNGQRCQVRNVRKAELYDVSVVISPFYGNDATAVSARSATDAGYVQAMRAKLAAMNADFERSERAHEIKMGLIADGRTNDDQDDPDNLDAFEVACRTLGLDYCDVDTDQNFIYASDPDDLDEKNCLRFSYEIDDEGNIVLNEDSRTKVRHELLHTERGRKILFFKRIKRSAGR